jgi:homoserine acetyltransferase
MEEIISPVDELAASELESALVVGVSTDILFPPHQQRELADLLNESGIETMHHEIDCPHGHDAFLIDEENFIPLIRSYLDSLA